MLNKIKHISILLCVFAFINKAYAEPDLKLGFIGPLSGNAAILGADALPAIQIAIEEERALGTDIQLFVEDDQYLTQSSVNAYKKLTNLNSVDSMIFLTYGGVFALKDVMERDGTLVIDTLDCDNHIARISARNIICISKGTEDMGEVVAKSIIQKGINSVSFIYFDADPFMGTLAESTKSYLENNSKVKIIGYDGYSKDLDFKTVLLKSKRQKVGAYIFYGYDGIGNAMKQARNLKISEPFFSVNTIMSPGFREAGRESLEGTFVSTYMAPKNDRYNEFIKKFEQKTGKKPSFEVSTFPSYDAVKLLGAGVREYKKQKSTKPLKAFLTDYFYKVKGYDGLAGPITIDSDGATRTIKNDLFLYENASLKPLE